MWSHERRESGCGPMRRERVGVVPERRGVGVVP